MNKSVCIRIIVSLLFRNIAGYFVGSDGEDYNFLLKGHEDLRQDERVMQLFGLVNALLNTDQACSRKNLR